MTGLDDNAAFGKLCHRPASKSVSILVIVDL